MVIGYHNHHTMLAIVVMVCDNIHNDLSSVYNIIIIKNIILQHYSNDTRSGALPCQHGSGNESSQTDIQPAVNVCQDGRFRTGHADGKVGCQPREREVSLLTSVAEGLHR